MSEPGCCRYTGSEALFSGLTPALDAPKPGLEGSLIVLDGVEAWFDLDTMHYNGAYDVGFGGKKVRLRILIFWPS